MPARHRADRFSCAAERGSKARPGHAGHARASADARGIRAVGRSPAEGGRRNWSAFQMNKVKSVVFHGEKRVVLEDFAFDDSPPKPGELTGRTLVTLISPGTELSSAFERVRESPA